MKVLADIQDIYVNTVGVGSYGSLEQISAPETVEMLKGPIIDSALASGVKNGYRFSIKATPIAPPNPSSYEVTATPLKYGQTGITSFYLASPIRAIRGTDRKGLEASSSDPYIINFEK